MSFSQAQPVTVTMTPDNTLRVSIIPATNVQKAQPVGVARAGDNQTVTVRPSG